MCLLHSPRGHVTVGQSFKIKNKSKGKKVDGEEDCVSVDIRYPVGAEDSPLLTVSHTLTRQATKFK